IGGVKLRGAFAMSSLSGGAESRIKPQWQRKRAGISPPSPCFRRRPPEGAAIHPPYGGSFPPRDRRAADAESQAAGDAHGQAESAEEDHDGRTRRSARLAGVARGGGHTTLLQGLESRLQRGHLALQGSVVFLAAADLGVAVLDQLVQALDRGHG